MIFQIMNLLFQYNHYIENIEEVKTNSHIIYIITLYILVKNAIKKAMKISNDEFQ